MKPQNRHKIKLHRIGQNRGMLPRWVLINKWGNLRTYKTYKRALQAMKNVVWISCRDDD